MTNTLITKYRPRKFEDVLGQDKAVKALRKAVESGTSRTILLTGPPGIGKTTLARIAAKAAGCDSGDILEIDAATNTGIDDMRHIAETMNYTPMAGDSKAVILDEAHALSKQAVGSLLKAFEEPPEYGWWFMCTTEPTKVPAAMKSRCLHLALRPVALPILTDMLTKVWKAEKFKTKADILVLCAEEAKGSPRQALVNLAACIECKDIKEAADVLASATDNPQAIDLARALTKNKVQWATDIHPLLAGMRDLNAESVRQVIRAYMTAIVLKVPQGFITKRALLVLQAFDQPFNSQDGITPLIVACAKLVD